MNTQEILNLNTTKTKKIELLLLQGFTRKEVANLIANGNYGFVQNVYTKMKAEGRLNLTFTPTEFNRKFGIEIEAYNIDKDELRRALKCAGIDCRIGNRNDTNRHYWKIVEDDSIDGHQSFELVSPVLQGTAGLEKVKKVCQILKELNAYVNKTCGLHIHFDAKDMELKHFKQVILNYANLEQTINTFLPKSRHDNRYCKSLKTIYKLETRVRNAQSLEQLINIQLDRYYNVNITSYARHNTIEFRQHSGTIEFEKINYWIQFLHNLVSYSEHNLVGQDNLESIKKFNPQEISTYIHNRANELA